MAIYTPSRGQRPSGLCGCGRPATTEIQVGWHQPPSGAGGGQYEEMCEACFADFCPPFREAKRLRDELRQAANTANVLAAHLENMLHGR